MQSEGIWMKVKVVHQPGWSISALAREFDLSWRTVKREVTTDGPRQYPERGREIIFQHGDKDFSLTDAIGFAVEQRLQITRTLLVRPSCCPVRLHCFHTPDAIVGTRSISSVRRPDQPPAHRRQALPSAPRSVPIAFPVVLNYGCDRTDLMCCPAMRRRTCLWPGLPMRYADGRIDQSNLTSQPSADVWL